MVSKSALRSAQKILRTSRSSYEFANFTHSPASIRRFSTPRSERLNDVLVPTAEDPRPRWSYTPERMKMPVRVRLKDPRKKWFCNDSPARLDRFYIHFLGPDGGNLLSEEVKWLAVTHKSFEQGARGFNDRLAFLGRRILNLQAATSIIFSETFRQCQFEPEVRTGDRVPFKHSALEGLMSLTNMPLESALDKKKLADYATDMGIRTVLRWTPRNMDDLDASGVDAVVNTAVFAIIGAIALERGGDIAASHARLNILKPLNVYDGL